MNKLLSFFLPFYRHSFETTLSEERIIKKISEIEPYAESPYYSRVQGNHFIVGEQVIQSYYCGWPRNAFAPVFSAKIEKRGERVLVKATVRMWIALNAIILPFYFLLLAISAIGLIAFPINVIGAIAADCELWSMFPMYWIMTLGFCLLFHFAFKRPSRKLIEHVEHLIYYDTEV
jgi:hypothetical protein